MRRFATALAVVCSLALAPAASAQTDTAAWVAWTRDHQFPIAALSATPGDDFADLQFLRNIIGERRLVQLGESGHGVAEFNSAKVRLIQFLHQQMGFDVIAFESSLFECFVANTHGGTGAQMLQAAIFGVWATEEVTPLFDYIQKTQSSDRPLVLAGFDVQFSGAAMLGRPAFFRRIVGAIDEGYAAEVEAFDTEFVRRVRSEGTSYAVQHEVAVSEFYTRLETFLRDRRPALAAAFPGDLSPVVAERAAWSSVRFVQQLAASGTRPPWEVNEGVNVRDRGMADNLTFVRQQMYAGRKVIVWAHNFHIRHANAATASPYTTMGQFVAERFRDELYTIGLYMNRGTAALNNRTVYAISPAPEGSMEWVLASAGPPALFVDFLHQRRESGNAWMFQPVGTREWGTERVAMVPRDQYDGVLFIDLVRSPAYLQR
jgi:erythromycin esterase